MSNPAVPKLVSKDIAELISDLSVEVVVAILRLSSFGFNPDQILQYCEKVKDGEELGSLPTAGSPKPLVIQAYSFLSDTSICVKKFGMELSTAAATLELIKTDPEGAVATVREVVGAYLQKQGSTKPVVVTLNGMPSSKGGPSISGDGGKAELAALMKRYQTAAGSYKFEAVQQGPVGPEHYMVRLGGNLVTVGQNKVVAVKAAALVRVLGRKHPVLVKYVRLYAPGRSLAAADKIKDSVYDGTLAPDDKLPEDETPSGSKIG